MPLCPLKGGRLPARRGRAGVPTQGGASSPLPAIPLEPDLLQPGRVRVHVLLIGATGLIGTAVLARLQAEGLRLRLLARGAAPAGAAGAGWVRRDLRAMLRPEDWLPLLDGIDAVVNCAGVLQDSGRDATAAVHRDAPVALFTACEAMGIRRVIHVSALGAEKESLSPFSATKRAAEAALMARDLDWVILRPSVVLGRAAYGGSALFRGLASLPVLPRIADAGRIQPVQLDDVAETVARLLRPGAPSRVAMALAGPEALSFEAVVARYRRWLDRRPARSIGVSPGLMRLAYRLGDLAGVLGWRPPIRSTARREMVRGAEGDPAAWTRLIGIVPRSLDAALAAEPASVQERWFARLYLLKPLLIVVLALFWMLTGVISLGPGYAMGEALMREGGAGALSGASVIAGGIADLAIGAALLHRRSARPALLAALALSVAYLVAGTLILPRLWADPLGPLLKVAPILMLHLVALATLEDR
nr:SDR family oxidoreductase [Plastoroseomonas hellenica]